MARRVATIERDRWALLSAEAHHEKHPETFWIPSLDRRVALRHGDAAKLLFDIETRDNGVVIDRGVDRMWVIVTAVDGEFYVGALDSNPGKAEGLDLHPGTEVLFLPEHICQIDRPPDEYLVARFGPGFLESR